jgi:hypothetical protein
MNKANAAKKIYHHKMGSGGYKTLVSEWDKKGAALIAKGVIPATQQLPPRARNWFLGHGRYIDEQTWELISCTSCYCYSQERTCESTPRG